MHSSAAGDGAARAFRLWGHFAADLLCGTVIAAIAVALYPPPAALALTVPTALVAVVVACWLAMRQHDRSLCEHCVAALPLDAAERAARCRLRFRLAHAGNEPRLLVPYLAGLALVNFAPGPAGRVVWMLAQLTLVYLLRCTVTHRRLQPWCPWCRGGGQEDPASTDPLPDDDRQLA